MRLQIQANILTYLIISWMTFFTCFANNDMITESQTDHLDSVFIQQENSSWKMVHFVSKGQTLYTLHKKYQIPIDYLKKSNQLTSDALSIGDQIHIPLYKHKLCFVGNQSDSAAIKIPVYYRVRKGQTLFSLAVKTFQTTMQALRQSNQLQNDQLTPGQVLMVGWCELKQKKIIRQQPIPDKYKPENDKNQQVYWQNKKTNSSKSISGIAFWDKSMNLQASNKLLGLFKSDIACKYVKITNPLTHRTAYVKSVSSLPYNAKTKGCIIQLTPSVAEALGAIDSRFYVEIEYIY